MKVDYAIVFVRDMSRSVAFYAMSSACRSVSNRPTGPSSAPRAPRWPCTRPARPVPARPADGPASGRCRPGLQVPDLEAFHRRMVEHGVTCLQPPKDQFGAKAGAVCRSRWPRDFGRANPGRGNSSADPDADSAGVFASFTPRFRPESRDILRERRDRSP
jgi:hypothetical protein